MAADAYYQKGKVAAHGSYNDIKEAQESFDEAIKRNPNLSEAYFERGYLKYKMITNHTVYDLFISYADADKAWVEGYLLDSFRQADIRFYSEAAFTLGVPRLKEFENAIQCSHRTLLIISPAYLVDNFSEFIDLLWQSYGLETATWPVIPLILHPVKLPTRLAMLTHLDATEETQWSEVIERLCAELQRPVPPVPPKPECPYPGMIPFSESNSDRFFGRNQEIQELLECLRFHRFLTVIGPSGVGKSSLVYAGLIPQLRRSGLFGAGEWRIDTMRPGETPLAVLTTALGSDLTDLGQAATQVLGTAPSAQRLLLVIDQFEEVFTVAGREAVPFQKTLLGLVEVPNCYVILTVRADFYPQLMESPLWQQIQSHRLEVVPLKEAGLRQAIVKPAEDVGVFIEPTLVERLVVDAAEEPGVLPLIQETLVLLWERVERRFLPLRAYEALILARSAYGASDNNNRTGLQVAIANRADAALAKLSEEQKGTVRRIFLRLIQFGEGRTDTRRQQPVEALRAAGDNPRLFDQILQHLVDCRLLTLSGKEGSSTKADIAHEALIGGWPTLQEWITERQEAEQTRRRLTAQAKEWVRLGKSSGGLLDEVELTEAERWLNSPDAADLGYDEALPALVAASKKTIQKAKAEKEERQQRELQLTRERLEQEKKAREQEQKALEQERKAREQEQKARKAAQTRNRIAAISLVVLTGLTAIAINQTIDARSKALDAKIKTITAVSTSSENLLVSNQQIEALIEGIKAGKLLQQTPKTPPDVKIQVVTALRQAVYETQEINRLQDHNKDGIYSVRFSPDGQILATYSADNTIELWKRDGTLIQKLPGNSPSFSPNGKILAFASTNNTVKLWSLNGKLLRTLPGQHNGEVYELSFSPNGQTLASASADKTIKLWNLDGKLLPTLQGHKDKVFSVKFSPDGKTLASASADKTVKLWSLDGKPPKTLQGHTDKVLYLNFSPDGKLFASASADKTIKLWSQDGKLLRSFPKDNTTVFTEVCFTPDGKTIASTSEDKTVKFWSLDGKLLQTLQGHKDRVTGVSFSPDGKTMASSSADNTVKLWSVAREPLIILKGHQDFVTSVSFSPDGQTIASGSNDGTIKLWNRDGKMLQTLQGHKDRVMSIRFSPNSQIIASASQDNTVKLWNRDGKLLQTLQGHKDKVIGVSFSPNGQIIASASIDGTIKLWNRNGGLLQTLEVNKEGPANATFSPDSRMVTSISADGTIKVWSLDGKLIETHEGHDQDIATVTFSPDGEIIAIANKDGTIKLRKRNGTQITTLTGHSDDVYDVSFSPDGKIIASVSFDQTIKLWSLEGRLLQTLQDNRPILSVSFSPDGKMIATGSVNKEVTLWDLDLDSLLKRGCNRLHDYLKNNPNLSENERQICTN